MSGVISNGYCVLNCPKGEIRAADGTCYSCDYPDPIWVDVVLYCSDICPNRIVNGSLNRYCSLPCGEGTFTGSDGKCYSCDEEKNIVTGGVSYNGCEQCPSAREIHRLGDQITNVIRVIRKQEFLLLI